MRIHLHGSYVSSAPLEMAGDDPPCCFGCDRSYESWDDLPYEDALGNPICEGCYFKSVEKAEAAHEGER